MQPYRDRSGTSGVDAYEIGDGWIRVRFKHGGTYVYDHERPGWARVERMKLLAKSGEGLATYITQHVREEFARREE